MRSCKIGTVMAILILALAAFLSAQTAREILSEIKYGNWCGLYNPPNPSENPAPIDKVDAACRKHDRAIATAEGHPTAELDSKLVTDLVVLMNSGHLDDREFAAAVIIATYMTGQQYVTVVSDIIDGKVSSTVKIATATGEVIVSLPRAVTAELLEEVAEKVGGTAGELIEISVKVLRLPGKVAEEIGDALEKVQKEFSRGWEKLKSWF